MSDTVHEPIRFASSLAVHSQWRVGVEQVLSEVRQRLATPIDIAVVFVSNRFAAETEQIASMLCDELGTERLFGCTSESQLGVGTEVEGEAGITLLVGSLPGVTLQPMHLLFERTADGGSILGWPDELIENWPADSSLMLVGDPYTFPADLLLERLNDEHPDVPVFGGMASGATRPGESRLLLGRETFAEGAIGLLMHGAMRVRTVVSQGCRPIGRHFVITKAERNVIHELGGKQALLQLKEVFQSLSNHEQALVQESLHLGRVVSEYQDHFEQGDFLVRNVMGVDQSSGAIVVGDFIRPGQTVQFHVRDAKTADDEMRQMLAQVRDQAGAQPVGGLLFTCNGRGTRLFPQPHHDADLVRQVLGNIPLAGFFAQGELGPVSGQNFMHGFTASLALFEPRA